MHFFLIFAFNFARINIFVSMNDETLFIVNDYKTNCRQQVTDIGNTAFAKLF